jgi:hypothetical protein
VLNPRPHRNKTRRHQQHDKTNPYHPFMHGNILSSIKALSDYSDCSPQLLLKNEELFGTAVRRSQNGTFPHAFHTEPKNKSQKVGMFLCTTQTTVSRPR